MHSTQNLSAGLSIGKIEGERMAALACINRVLLRAAELEWESASLATLEQIKDRLERVTSCASRNEVALRDTLTALRSATSRLNAVADVMKTPTDFSHRMPVLVTSASAIVGQVAKLRNGKH
jgi:hypothetical protein